VRVRDRIENRPQKGDRLDRRQRAAVAQEFGQVLARHILEDQIKIAAFFARLEDRHDIRVAQFADHARLVEQDTILRRIGTTEMQRLDRNLALQLRIEAEIDRALGTAPELATHLETTDTPGHSVSIQSNCATPSAVPKTMAFWPKSAASAQASSAAISATKQLSSTGQAASSATFSPAYGS